nr:wax ester/triacylglycerol synthase domain-containing protein [Streptomyces sp. ok210]
MHAWTYDWPSNSLTIGAILNFTGPVPLVEELQKHIQASLPDLPTLTHALAGPRLRARWIHEEFPDLQIRVRERLLKPGGLDTALRELIAEPLPVDGPPWDLWLLHGHAPGMYSVCYRAAHTTQDGVGVRNTLYALFSDKKPESPVMAPPNLGTLWSALKAQLGLMKPSNVWNDSERPLLGERVTGWAQVPTDLLRKTASPVQGSSNDASLACLTYILREWAAQNWQRAAEKPLKALVMVDGRTSEEANKQGNVFALAPIVLPCHVLSFEKQLAAVIEATRTVKVPSVRRAFRAMVERTPARVFNMAGRMITRPSRAVVDTSHVAFHFPMHYRTMPVTSVQMFTCLPQHHPLSIISCSYENSTSVYFVSDAAMPGMADLPQQWTIAVESAAASKLI